MSFYIPNGWKNKKRSNITEEWRGESLIIYFLRYIKYNKEIKEKMKFVCQPNQAWPVFLSQNYYHVYVQHEVKSHFHTDFTTGCVFQPAFGCCPHRKAGQITFFQPSSTFFFVLNECFTSVISPEEEFFCIYNYII